MAMIDSPPRSVHILLAVLLVAVVTALAPPAFAQPADIDELEHLSATLKDDKARARLIEQLDALAAARHGTDKTGEDGVIAGLSHAIGTIGEGASSAVTAIRDAPLLAAWAVGELANPAQRAIWGRILAELGAVLATGWLAERLCGVALARPRRMARPKPGAGLSARVPAACAGALLGLLPVASFAAAGWGVSLLLHHDGNARVAALMLIAAYGGLRLTLVAARAVLAPEHPDSRLLPVDDETAEYLAIWTRRIAGIGLFGWFAAEAARLLGLPPAGHLVVVKALGLTVAAMAAIFALQNRQPVAAAIRRAARHLGPRMQGLAERAAELWHVCAALYIAAVYLVWALPVAGGAQFMIQATVLTVIILAAARIAGGMVRRAVERAFAIGPEAKARFPLLEARANRYLPALQLALRLAVGAITALALLQAWGIGSFAWVTSDLGRRILASAISIATVLVGALLTWEVVAGVIERYLGRVDADGRLIECSARARTLLPLARNALFVVMAVMVTLVVLSELGIDIAPLLAGAGVVGIAIGFGSQKLVQDVITGAFILFEDTIAVGDVVKLDGHSGAVEAISIRAIRLRDAQGSVHTIPFSAVGTVVNMSREFAYATFEIRVSYREDLDRVGAALAAVGTAMWADPAFGPQMAEPLEVLGLERFDAWAVVVAARIKTLPLKQWAVAREFNRRVKLRFDAEGIEMPLQTTVRVDSSSSASASAASTTCLATS